jgi:hypothetical protein
MHVFQREQFFDAWIATNAVCALFSYASWVPDQDSGYCVRVWLESRALFSTKGDQDLNVYSSSLFFLISCSERDRKWWYKNRSFILPSFQACTMNTKVSRIVAINEPRGRSRQNLVFALDIMQYLRLSVSLLSKLKRWSRKSLWRHSLNASEYFTLYIQLVVELLYFSVSLIRASWRLSKRFLMEEGYVHAFRSIKGGCDTTVKPEMRNRAPRLICYSWMRSGL